ncbi:MAG: EamA family transporter [Lachnospiraceae bacterium]|nr:EamA family transporter [Lachnospiraceae bacterium]
MKKSSMFFVLMAGSLWGFMGLFVRKLNESGLDSMNIVALRAMVTFLLMGAFIAIYDRKLFVIKLKDIWCFIGTGVLSIVFFNFCYFKAITLTTLPVAAVLLYTAPAIVTVISSVLFKERINKSKVVALILTFVGCVMVTGVVDTKIMINGKGLVFGLGAGLGYALYSIFSRFAIIKGYHSFTIAFYTFTFATIATLPFSDYNSIGKVVFENVNNFVFSIVFGMISTVIPYILYNLGMKGLDNSKASIIASIEPVMASAIGIIVYDENVTIAQVVGISLVVFSIVMCNLKVQETKENTIL